MDTDAPAIDDDVAVARIVDELRAQRGMTVNALSRAARIPHTTFLRRLDGEPFKLDEARRVARILGTTVAAIETAAAELVAK
jgi:predicted transcriptional regulator